MKALLLLVLFLIPPAFAQTNSQVLPTEDGTLNIDFSTAPGRILPGDQVKVYIDFLNPQTNNVQEHIDYSMAVYKDDEAAFGPIPLTHTSTGSVTIPIGVLDEGTYTATIEIEGILFQPIPAEAVSFSIVAGDVPPVPCDINEVMVDGVCVAQPTNGCLIATAAYGSELAPQVQQLREIRDNVVLGTESGSAFMGAFDAVYYSFSPIVADLERENPVFREVVKLGLTPMLATLGILNYVDVDSEAEMLAYGSGVILLNAGIYLGIPALAVLKLRGFGRDRRQNA